ncbi:MAG: glycosyltransferase family 2 protein [Candidatus Saccharimonadales bacterium]
MLPALISYGALVLLIVLSFVSPLLAAIYLLAVIITTLIKAGGIAFHTITGHRKLQLAQKIDWHTRLGHLEDPIKYVRYFHDNHSFEGSQHIANLQEISINTKGYPKPSEIYNVAIIATYNESYDVLQPTLQSLADTTYDKSRLIVVIGYEERGGTAIESVVKRLEKEYKNVFKSLLLVQHPSDMPNEVVGKGGNITYAGLYLKQWINDQKIAYKDVIITTLDSDNRPHVTYFDYLTYEYIVHPDRKNLSFQPVCLFMNNIWDVPAPMRVVATGNSFWNIISSMRPHTLRNFASHSQPMDALVEMNFWSTRTIVEDGHQYWRSYFHFNGDYAVVSIFVPIYQDAVLSSTYIKTLKAQFIQLRRWAYGASDVPFVAVRLFSRERQSPFVATAGRLIRLIDSHVSLSSAAILISIGGWVPLLINSEASHNIAAHQLPEVISSVQQIALIGLFITIFLAFKILPPRPLRYKRHRTIGMVLQWLLMPITAILYNSASAFTAQTALLLGRYYDKFDVTEKATKKVKNS